MSRRRIARGEGVAELLRFDADGGEHGRLSRIWRLVAARVVGGCRLGLSLLAQQVIFGPLAVTAIVLAVLDKFLWLGVVFVALPSATLFLGMFPLIMFAIGVTISGGRPTNRPYQY